MPSGFIFDLDGTLADSMPAHYQAWTLVAGRYGLSFPEDQFYRMGGVPTAKIAAQLVAAAGLTLDPVAVAHEKEQLYVTSLTGGVLLPLLTGLKTFQYPSPLHVKQIPPLVKDTKAAVLLATDTFVNQYAIDLAHNAGQ